MFVYRNSVSGKVIKVPSRITGKDWVEAVPDTVAITEPAEEPKPKKKPAKKKTAKKEQ